MNWSTFIQDEIARLQRMRTAMRRSRLSHMAEALEVTTDPHMRELYLRELNISDDPGAALDYVPDWAEKL